MIDMDEREHIQAAVESHMRRYDEALERVCELALEGGEHGVLVVWEGTTFTISIDPTVPYGQIYERRLP